MSEPTSKGWNIGAKLQGFFWFLAVALCASTIIGSSLFIVFLNLAIRGETYLGPSDAPFVWLIPLLTCLAAGVTIGNVRNAIKILVPIMFFSVLIAVSLSSIPVILGVIVDVSTSNQFVMAVLSTDLYLFILTIFTMFFGLIVGGMLGGKAGR